MKYLNDLNLSQNELRNAVIQPLASDPSSPLEGQAYFNTVSNKLRVFNGTTWDEMGSSSATGDMEKSVYDPQLIQADAFARANHTGTQALSTITGLTASSAELNILDGALLSTTELNYVDGVTSAIQTQINSKASLASPAFTGTPTAPTATAGTTTTQLATTAFVGNAVSALVDAAPGTLDTLNELAAALGDDPNFATTITTNLAGKLDIADNLSDVANAATAFTNIKQNASTTATGVVELATQAEAQAKTDTTRAVTAASLADFARKVTGTIGNGTLTSLPVTHGLGTQWVTAQVFDATTGEQVICDVTITSATVVTFIFATATTANQYRYVIIG